MRNAKNLPGELQDGFVCSCLRFQSWQLLKGTHGLVDKDTQESRPELFWLFQLDLRNTSRINDYKVVSTSPATCSATYNTGYNWMNKEALCAVVF